MATKPSSPKPAKMEPAGDPPPPTPPAPPRPPAPAGRRRRSAVAQPARCQVEGCHVDLTGSKTYYCRHKVCGTHSKAARVVVNGLAQRFCQQCSRFHNLEEFDQRKRSCRRRLAGHNERRRKHVPFSTRFGGLASSFHAQDPNRFMDFVRRSSVRPVNPFQPPFVHTGPNPYGLGPRVGIGTSADSSCALSLLSNGSMVRSFNSNDPFSFQADGPDAPTDLDSSRALSLLSNEPLGFRASNESLGFRPSNEPLGFRASNETLGFRASNEPLGFRASNEQLGFSASNNEPLGFMASNEPLGFRANGPNIPNDSCCALSLLSSGSAISSYNSSEPLRFKADDLGRAEIEFSGNELELALQGNNGPNLDEGFGPDFL